MKRTIVALTVAGTVLFTSGCGLFEGYFLNEGATEDVGLVLDVAGTTLDNGRVYLFDPGEPAPSAVYDLVNWVVGPAPGAFTSDLVNSSNPSDTGTISGTQSPGSTSIALHLDSGDRNEALALVEPKAYDPYKCWGGAGDCHPVFDTPTCVVTPGPVTPDGPTVNVSATMAFKDHDGVLPGARLGVGWKGLGGSELGYDATRTIPGTDPYGGGQVTTALTGTTEGTLTYDLTNAEHPADATDLIVEVDAVDADPGYFGFSNRVFCPLG